MAWCDICEGRGRITLPLRRQMTAIEPIDDGASMVEASQRFPCPKCRIAQAVDPKRITAIRVNDTVETRFMKDPAVVRHRQEKLARLVAKIIVERSMASVTTRETEDGRRTILEMTLGLVRPKGTAGPNEIQEVEVARDLPPLPPEFAPPPKPKPAARPLGSRQLDLE